MGIEKAEIKSGTLNAYAGDLDKAIEAQSNEVHKLDGAATALKAAGKNIEGVMVALNAAVDEEEIEVPGDVAATAKLVMSWIRRCYGVTIAMADQNTVQGLQLQGRIQGLTMAKKGAESIAAQEIGKAEAIRETEEGKGNVVQFPGGRRPVGVHPGPSRASQLKAETRKDREGAQKATGGPKQGTDGETPQETKEGSTEAPVAKKPKPKTRRKRRKGN